MGLLFYGLIPLFYHWFFVGELGLQNADSVLGLSEFSFNFGEISVPHFCFVEQFLNLLLPFWEFNLTLLVKFLNHFLILM